MENMLHILSYTIASPLYDDDERSREHFINRARACEEN
jgi:hypothetical protein